MKHPLVLVKWLDSCHRDGWTLDPPNNRPVSCRSVGWVVAKNRQAITLSAHITKSGRQRMHDVTIPASAIQSVRKL